MIYYSGTNLGFYDTDIHPVESLPADAVEITDVAYQDLMDAQAAGFKIVPDMNGYPIAQAYTYTSAEKIALYEKRIEDTYRQELAILYGGYPEEEINSWFKQEAEAYAYLADSGAATPWIDAAAAERGITKADYVNKIVAKVGDYTVLHGTATGRRHKYYDRLYSLGDTPTDEQLESIFIESEWP